MKAKAFCLKLLGELSVVVVLLTLCCTHEALMTGSLALQDWRWDDEPAPDYGACQKAIDCIRLKLEKKERQCVDPMRDEVFKARFVEDDVRDWKLDDLKSLRAAWSLSGCPWRGWRFLIFVEGIGSDSRVAVIAIPSRKKDRENVLNWRFHLARRGSALNIRRPTVEAAEPLKKLLSMPSLDVQVVFRVLAGEDTRCEDDLKYEKEIRALIASDPFKNVVTQENVSVCDVNKRAQKIFPDISIQVVPSDDGHELLVFPKDAQTNARPVAVVVEPLSPRAAVVVGPSIPDDEPRFDPLCMGQKIKLVGPEKEPALPVATDVVEHDRANDTRCAFVDIGNWVDDAKGLRPQLEDKGMTSAQLKAALRSHFSNAPSTRMVIASHEWAVVADGTVLLACARPFGAVPCAAVILNGAEVVVCTNPEDYPIEAKVDEDFDPYNSLLRLSTKDAAQTRKRQVDE